MKIEAIGTITRIGQPKKAGNGEVREVVLNKKYHDPDTGELKSEDNYPVQIWETDFKAFETQYHKSAKMRVKGFINGRLVGEGEESRCFMNFVGKKFEAI